MDPRISTLIARIEQIEEEIEEELRRRRIQLHADFEHRRVAFERHLVVQQRQFRRGVLQYLRSAELRNVATAPFIYLVFFPLLLLDLAITLYQFVCFPLYRVARLHRADYFVFDRTHLAYLNVIEKVNCAYCSYANGLATYLREIAGRTEQYWCPIKHSRRVLAAHPYYNAFVDFGDAEDYRRQLQELREELRKLAAARSPGDDTGPL